MNLDFFDDYASDESFEELSFSDEDPSFSDPYCYESDEEDNACEVCLEVIYCLQCTLCKSYFCHKHVRFNVLFDGEDFMCIAHEPNFNGWNLDKPSLLSLQDIAAFSLAMEIWSFYEKVEWSENFLAIPQGRDTWWQGILPTWEDQIQKASKLVDGLYPNLPAIIKASVYKAVHQLGIELYFYDAYRLQKVISDVAYGDKSFVKAISLNNIVWTSSYTFDENCQTVIN